MDWVFCQPQKLLRHRFVNRMKNHFQGTESFICFYFGLEQVELSTFLALVLLHRIAVEFAIATLNKKL